jgi:hypothetical protein
MVRPGHENSFVSFCITFGFVAPSVAPSVSFTAVRKSPASWRLLIPELKRPDGDAFAIDLPVDEPEAGATHYADVIGAQIRSRKGNDTIAVAHSVCGIFLPLLPERCAVRRLTFLAAFVPELGISPFSSSPPTRAR